MNTLTSICKRGINEHMYIKRLAAQYPEVASRLTEEQKVIYIHRMHRANKKAKKAKKVLSRFPSI